MGSSSQMGSMSIAPPMVIREKKSNHVVGVVQNHSQPGGIAVYVVYLDPMWRRAGLGFEATALYISHLFDSGARLVAAEILEFNTQVIAIMGKGGLEPHARMREHVFVAGHYWDLLIYTIERTDWLRIIERYRRILPGGARKPAAIGTRRPRA